MFLQNSQEYLHFLILVIKVFFFFTLIHLVKGLSILLSFSKNQILISLLFSYFSSLSFISVLFFLFFLMLLPSSNNTREDSTHGHHQIVNSKIRLIIFFAAKDLEALYSQQKQDQELTVAQIINSLLPNSDLN